MRRLSSSRVFRVLTLVGMLIVGFGAGAGYMAFASTTGDTYYACVTSKGDIYRVRVNAKYACLGSDKSISWNQRGQPGPVGPTGAQGPEGPEGPEGQAGQDGEAGEDAPPVRLICPGCNLKVDPTLFQDFGDLTKAYLVGANMFGTD